MGGALEARNCPNCGAALDARAAASNRLTCRYCGHAFELPRAPAPPPRQVVLNIPRDLSREVAAAQRDEQLRKNAEKQKSPFDK